MLLPSDRTAASWQLPVGKVLSDSNNQSLLSHWSARVASSGGITGEAAVRVTSLSGVSATMTVWQSAAARLAEVAEPQVTLTSLAGFQSLTGITSDLQYQLLVTHGHTAAASGLPRPARWPVRSAFFSNFLLPLSYLRRQQSDSEFILYVWDFGTNRINGANRDSL